MVRIFVVKLSVLYIFPVVELVLWKHILLKIYAFV